MISSTPRAVFPLSADAGPAAGVSAPADFYDEGEFETWHHIGAVAEVAVWDEANRAKDRQDEALDAMRVSGGMTLDEFLAQK